MTEQKIEMPTWVWEQQLQQSYSYDRYGNRTINAAQTWGTGVNAKQFTVDTTTNRLGVPSGQSGVMNYDDAGNLITDSYTGAGARNYDAENRMTQAWGGDNQWQYYTYNADGQRTRRKINNQETWLVYGFGGELLAEYPANGAAANPQKEYGYRNGQMLITAESGSSRMNLALATNGATATASSVVSGNYPASSTINGDRRGLNWNNGGGWNDGTINTHPDWLQIDFNGSKTIDEINVITLQDTPATPAEPTEAMTFTLYGLTGYSVQYWNGSAWVTVSGGTVTGNNKVWRKFTFSPITTTKIRVLTSSSPDAYSRITEVEAWGNGTPPSRTNFALGGLTSASSTISANYPAVSTINGDRRGLNWNFGGGWNDATVNTHPDWLQIDFSSSKTIDEIDVFTLQDTPATPAEPTESMTFSLYGLTAYDVQYWNNSTWVTIPGGSVTGNNKVWRKFTFSPITTSKIRVLTNASLEHYSRITEVEAWGPTEAVASAGVKWLVADHLGTPRIIVNQTGNLAGIKRHDYLPFGEELFAGTGGRTAPMGYAGDGVRQQFTLKERDNETGLDYFLARYYSSTQGRFTSADEPFAGQDAEDPQTWNLYSYTSGNPLNRFDPDGRRWFYKCEKNGCDVQWVNPNEDGSYTSPGEGYTAFVPTRGNRWLYVWNEDGTRVLYLGEKDDGSPDVRNLWVGRTENASWDIVGLFIPGKLTFKGLAAGASALWAKHLAKKGATESIEAVARGATKIVAKDGTEITGLTKHAVNRVVGDAGKRAGTKPEAILDALKNPIKIKEGVDKLGRPYKVFQGANARVVVNPQTGKIVSTNPLSGAGAN